MRGIKGGIFESVELQVDSNPQLKNDFEGVKTLYSDFIKK